MNDKPAGLMQDNEGNSSSLRLITLVWALVILITWVAVCAYKRDMVDIPVGVGGVLVGILFNKAVQKFAEVKNANSSVN